MDGSQGTAGTRRSVGTVVRHHLLSVSAGTAAHLAVPKSWVQ